MRVNLKKRLTALMMAGMMVTSNVLPAYSATETTASGYQDHDGGQRSTLKKQKALLKNPKNPRTLGRRTAA